jgi:hypothetical protein
MISTLDVCVVGVLLHWKSAGSHRRGGGVE